MIKSQVGRWVKMVSTWDDVYLIDVYSSAVSELSTMMSGRPIADRKGAITQTRYVNFLRSEMNRRGIRR
jgi:hypothetical protein